MPKRLDFLYHETKAHWLLWRLDYEYLGPWTEKRVIRCDKRLGRFTSEFGVKRLIPDEANEMKDNWSRFCDYVRTNVRDVMSDESGSKIQEFATRSETRYYTKQRCSILSLSSKIGMILRPDVFHPFDSFGREGIKALEIGKNISPSTDYTEFLGIVRKIWMHDKRIDAIKYYLSEFPEGATEHESAFKQRFFDIWLMACGNRYGFENNPLNNG